MDAYDKAFEMGATIRGGINWDWAIGFQTEEVARQFIEWLQTNGYEHRGVYPPHNGEPIGVRFRRAIQ